MQKRRIVLVFDESILRDGLSFVLSSRPEFSVVAQAGTLCEALDVARRECPDILIVDPGDADPDFTTIASIAALPSSPKVLVFSAHSSVEHAIRSLDAGATGYLTSMSTSSELLEAVQTMLGGDTFISSSIASKLVASLRTAALRKAAAKKMKLTLREEQIVGLLHKGKTNREIAHEIGLTEKTVKHYMTVLMQKVAARSRLEVVLALKDFELAVSPSQSRAFN